MFWQNWLKPKPFNTGFLPEKDGHHIWFAEFGNPQGIPVIIFHGGPGGSNRNFERAKFANRRKYRIIMFDQRGCGNSLYQNAIYKNTTTDLLNDTTRLVNYLKIDKKIILWGASWGSTLALLWAEQNPEKVEKLLLNKIFLANKEYNEWEFNCTNYIYPEFVEIMKQESHDNIKKYYNNLIQSDNLAKQLQATNRYGWFERICGSMAPSFSEFTTLSEQELASQRIYMHYSYENFFLKSNQILDNINKIKDISTTIIHNRLDLICPFKGAYDLHKKLPNSRLIVVPDFGHTGKKINCIVKKIITEELQ